MLQCVSQCNAALCFMCWIPPTIILLCHDGTQQACHPCNKNNHDLSQLMSSWNSMSLHMLTHQSLLQLNPQPRHEMQFIHSNDANRP